MAERHWDEDDSLLADLAEAIAGLEGHEQAVATLGRGAFAWRTVDDDLLLAALSYDSLREPATNLRSSDDPYGGDDPEASGDEPRTLIFNSSPLSIELEVMNGRMVGQLVPPSTGTVVIEATGTESLTVEADELGFFVVGPPPAGPVRIRCETATARLVTDWIRL